MSNPNARDRILKSAIKVFAEKSFEGSRIDEIAKEANVPKSLIYYHFRSKDEILQVLTDEFINEYRNIASEYRNESHRDKASNMADRMKKVYFEFGQRNADLIRVIFIDSLKKSKAQPAFLNVIDAMISMESGSPAHMGDDIQERRIAEFFTSFITNCAYICFADTWTRYFNIERAEFDELYIKIYNQTHGAYHKAIDTV